MTDRIEVLTQRHTERTGHERISKRCWVRAGGIRGDGRHDPFSPTAAGRHQHRQQGGESGAGDTPRVRPRTCCKNICRACASAAGRLSIRKLWVHFISLISADGISRRLLVGFSGWTVGGAEVGPVDVWAHGFAAHFPTGELLNGRAVLGWNSSGEPLRHRTRRYPDDLSQLSLAADYLCGCLDWVHA